MLESEPKTTYRRDLINGVLLGTLVGFVFAFGGYLLVMGDHSQFGMVMFLLVPFVSGLAIALVVRKASPAWASTITTLVFTFSILLITGLEAIICCVMALPLWALGMFLGAGIGRMLLLKVIEQRKDSNKTIGLILLACPFLIAAADKLEEPVRRAGRTETFETRIHITTTPEETWRLLAEMQQLDGPKPLLLRIGLPVPQSCTLDNYAVGGQRICYFDTGIIAQKVSIWQQPKMMGLEITDSTLPGRHWLGFVDASYELFPRNGGTEVIRRTTINSRLYPRWYWRPLEEWGVTSEHVYVLTNLERWARR